jgi:hypothetical protein
MKFVQQVSKIQTVRQEDPKFVIYDGLMQAPRAGFEISQDCPREHKLIIMEAIKNQWLMPVANLTERELIFVGLTR